MTKTPKIKTTRKKMNHHGTKSRGGKLIMNSDDLINTHLCTKTRSPRRKDTTKGKPKETTGEEVYTCNGDAVQLNTFTLGYLQQQYRKNDGHWFKFVIFNNDDINYIYIINGGQINKHSVCMLLGLLDITKENNEYEELRVAVNELLHFKLNISALDIMGGGDRLRNKLHDLINNVDEVIDRDIRCTPVLAAGSGTVNEDGSICINNKSGHYKPTIESMETAKSVFESACGVAVHITEKVDKEALEEKYGAEHKNYSGICL